MVDSKFRCINGGGNGRFMRRMDGREYFRVGKEKGVGDEGKGLYVVIGYY